MLVCALLHAWETAQPNYIPYWIRRWNPWYAWTLLRANEDNPLLHWWEPAVGFYSHHAMQGILYTMASGIFCLVTSFFPGVAPGVRWMISTLPHRRSQNPQLLSHHLQQALETHLDKDGWDKASGDPIVIRSPVPRGRSQRIKLKALTTCGSQIPRLPMLSDSDQVTLACG